MSTISKLSPTRKRVITKLSEIFSTDFTRFDFDIVTYRGSQDADAFRWFTIGLTPRINSHLTMTEFIKNDVMFHDRGWSSNEGIIIERGTNSIDKTPTFSDK